MNNLENKIEAILFFKGEPITLKKLSDILEVSIEEIKQALFSLGQNLENRGIVLVENEDQVYLGINKENSLLIEKIQKEDLNRDLSKASLETLSIILYKNGSTRQEIDFIRGVNSSFSLRILAIRGLIDKTQSKEDTRKYIYKPTFDLLSYLGISKIEDMPGFNDLKENLDILKDSINEENI